MLIGDVVGPVGIDRLLPGSWLKSMTGVAALAEPFASTPFTSTLMLPIKVNAFPSTCTPTSWAEPDASSA